MANSIPVAEQLAIACNLIRSRPKRILLLLLLAAAVPIVARKYEPIMVKYTARLANPEREIETLFIVNPNVEKREVLLDLSPNGDVIDLGIDPSTAIDLSSKSPDL